MAEKSIWKNAMNNHAGLCSGYLVNYHQVFLADADSFELHEELRINVRIYKNVQPIISNAQKCKKCFYKNNNKQVGKYDYLCRLSNNHYKRPVQNNFKCVKMVCVFGR